MRPIAELRKKYEPKIDHNKITTVVKVANNIQDPEEEEEDPVALDEIAIVQPEDNTKPISTKDKEDKDEKSYNVETEPDLRKDDREEEYQSYRSIGSYRFNRFKSLLSKTGHLTERIGCNDRPKPELDSSEIIENIVLLPSPKESDALINHREADAFFENNSNDVDTTVKEVRMSKSKPKIPPFSKSNSAIFGSMTNEATEIVTVDEPTIEGHKVDEIRFLTGIDNLNSPLGRHVKIEFNNNMNNQQQAVQDQ